MQDPVPLPGDLVWIRRRRWRVERVRRDRHVVCLDVRTRDRRLTFLSPFDRVFAVERSPTIRQVRPQYARARLAHLIASVGDIRVPSALVTADADILPYQLEPAMAVLAGRTRVLLADEVGLGKTIQAGLVVAELARRDRTVRIIILAPASLREQWSDELRKRFGLTCLAADRAGLDAVSRAGAFGDNPWHRPGIWIASPDFLKQRHVADAIPRTPWDLLVVDEAHAACGDSDRYELVDRLARASRRVLLLTATPHSGDQSRFDRLINVGRIDALDAGLASAPADDLTMFRRTRGEIGGRPEVRVRWRFVGLSKSESTVLSALRAFELAVLKRAEPDDHSLLLLSVFRKRALSTMWAFSQSIARRLSWLGDAGPDAAVEMSQLRLGFDVEPDPTEQEERVGILARIGLEEKQERSWLRRLRALAEEASREESKIRRLMALLDRNREPVIVFTEFRDSLDAVRRQLPFDRPASILHGGQDAIERRQQLKLFLDGQTSVLIATDVAGQGLNLQSRSRWVVSLELPWNPTKLEQRIGRVDRIGQRKPTRFTLLVARDESESGLLTNLSRRILTARRTIGADILSTVLPPEEAVRRALLFHAPLSGSDTGAITVPACHRWKRMARIAAESLARRRSLSARWRTALPPAAGAIRCNHPRAARFVPRSFESLWVFSVPVLDAADEFVERLVIGIGAREPASDSACCRAIAAALRHKVLAVARRRIRSWTIGRERAVKAALSRDHAIAAATGREFALHELQPGLFDQREIRTFDAEARDICGAQAEIERAIERAALAGNLRPGEPLLEMVLSRRR